MESAVEREDAAASQVVVLLVEDEILIRLMAADEFRDHGYSVIEASNADEALAILGSEAVVDLVFTDVRMPGSLDGIGLARLIRDRYPGLPVLMASGHMNPGDASGLVDGFFVKPYDPAKVARFIRLLFPPEGT